MKNNTVITTLCLFLSLLANAQLTQNIRGKVVDADSKSPLFGATITVFSNENRTGGISNENGEFQINDVPIGRINITVQMMGYEDRSYSQIDLKSAKELVLDIQLEESYSTVNVVVITGKKPKDKPLNEMASLSARSFTVEETSRYAAAAFDPARMAQNFAGVTSGGEDLYNEIVVRGNSPKGILWRLEGIEIANPNHFAQGGSQGGAISMLSSSTLGNSDFYTGAFPSEYGNALSGVFDLTFRKGNNQKRENSFMFGALGLEVSTEGPFTKKYEGSYLVNYRYSTLGLLQKIGLSPTGDLLPIYQDLSYNIVLPTNKIGHFNVFGVLGQNIAEMYDEFDQTDTSRKSRDHYEGRTEIGFVNTTGIKHIINLNNKSYVKSVLSHSYSNTNQKSESLEIDSVLKKPFQFNKYSIANKETSLRLSSMFNYKFNNKNVIRVGAIVSKLDYDFSSVFHDYEENSTFIAFDDKNKSLQYQAYTQWKSRITSKLTLNLGFHYTHLQATSSSSFEPRASLAFKASEKSKLSLAIGKHSRPEHLSLYLYNFEKEDGTYIRPNKNLEISKAWHYVIGYDHKFNANLRFKAEAYYQHLFDIPISAKEGSTISSINTSNYWDAIFNGDTIQFNNNGVGTNIGLDLTLERFFANNFYYLVTATLFNSKYKTQTQKTYNTRYNGNYQLNILGGKEFILRQKNRKFGINGKMVFYGGNRYTPIDLSRSISESEMIVDNSKPFDSQVPDYIRFDIGVSYKFNRAKTTHSIMFDVQNLTNRQNIGGYYYDDSIKEISNWAMTGFFPFFNYRIEF